MNKLIFITSSALAAIGISLFAYTLTTDKLHKKNKRGQDIGKIQSFKNDLGKLKKFQRAGHDQNPELIEIYEKQAQTYHDEVRKIKGFLQEKNKNLNHFFGNKSRLPTPGKFESQYVTAMRKLSENFIRNCGANPELDKGKVSKSISGMSSLKDWNGRTPKNEELRPAMRKFNILSALYSSLKAVEVHELLSISMTLKNNFGKSRNDDSPVHPTHTLIPLKIVCRVETKQVTELITSLLENKQLIFQIEEISAVAVEGSKRLKNKKTLKNGLEVTLNLSIYEFSPEKVS